MLFITRNFHFSLAPVSNEAKHKWLYAVSLIPMSKIPREELTAQPPDVTESPYAGETAAQQVGLERIFSVL